MTKVKEPRMTDEEGLLLAKLIYALGTIQFMCENLKNRNKKKIDINSILSITKEVLDKND